jgi:hypothetical protein
MVKESPQGEMRVNHLESGNIDIVSRLGKAVSL